MKIILNSLNVGIDALYGGIATHYCDSSKILELEKALIDLDNANDVENVLNEFCPKIQSEFSFAKHLDRINRCFSAPTVEAILKNLEKDGTEWAIDTIKVKLLRFIDKHSANFTIIDELFVYYRC